MAGTASPPTCASRASTSEALKVDTENYQRYVDRDGEEQPGSP